MKNKVEEIARELYFQFYDEYTSEYWDREPDESEKGMAPIDCKNYWRRLATAVQLLILKARVEELKDIPGNFPFKEVLEYCDKHYKELTAQIKEMEGGR